MGALTEITNNILIDQMGDYWIFHAAAVAYAGVVTLFLGDSGTGKSSFCFICGLHKSNLLSDEPVLIDKKTYKVYPFKYIQKIEHFQKNFSRWNMPSKQNLNQYKYYHIGSKEIINFNVITKNILDEIGIRTAIKSYVVKNIVFLEKKRYDPLLHLFKHCLNKEDKGTFFKSFNSFLRGKRIIFLPKVNKILHRQKEIKHIVKKVLYG